MNPSAPDWIPNFINRFQHKKLVGNFTSPYDFYSELKRTGFIYGVSVSAIPKGMISHLKLTREELTKVNLFHSLYYTYFSHVPVGTDEELLKSIVAFYKYLEMGKSRFFQKLNLSHTLPNQVENILSARVQESAGLLKKNSVSILTYAFLYCDILAYQLWLKDPNSTKTYYRNLENDLIQLCFEALNSKKKKNKYDILLLELFENPTGNYAKEEDKSSKARLILDKELADMPFQKLYKLDLCCLAMWSDGQFDINERLFLDVLLEKLELTSEELDRSIGAITSFTDKQGSRIRLFEYSHPIKIFYKQSAATVKLLIIRNKDRLLKELNESGELVILLGHSARRDLTPKEKSKVKLQLLDICKTIPSLAIFLLPGGSVLLPLLVKFIPKLLPSAFQDNRIK